LAKSSKATIGAIVLIVGFMLMQLALSYPSGVSAAALMFFLGVLVLVWGLAWLFYVLVWEGR
jgi:hypothetical protein